MRPRFSDDKVFIEGSTHPRHRLKERFLKLVPHQCAICGQSDTWNGLKLVLQLDHKNGIHNDNRRENLQLVCPNCHSQTETYAGRNSLGMRSAGAAKPNFRKEKTIRDRELWEQIKHGVVITHGWKSMVSQKIGVTPQKVVKWLTRVDPEFLGP